MTNAADVSRRSFLAGIAGVAVTSRLARAAAADADAPSITRNVEKLFKITGSTQPNDMQFVREGLWVLDQKDPNKAFLVKPEDGTILRTLQTESIHGSGITFGNGARRWAFRRFPAKASIPGIPVNSQISLGLISKQC